MTDQVQMQIWCDTEKKLLGAILQQPRNFRIVAERLTADDFYLPSDQVIYRCIEAMHEDGRGVDSLTLTNELMKLGQVDNVGGAAYISHLDESLPRFYRDIPQWVATIAEASFTHKLRMENARFQEQLQQAGADVQAILADHKDRLAAIERSNMCAPSTPMFEDMAQFAASAEATVDWLVRDLIPRGANGIIGGDPKASKSFAALDIAMSVACGASWMGFHVPRRAKVAVVSREDSPGLTQRRIKKLITGRAEYDYLPDWALINTKRHQADFKVTTPENMNRLIDELGRFGAEFVVLDVFRSLHDEEESSNTQVAVVLDKISRLQKELGCATALVHHISKVDTPNIFSGLRGASVIHGWMEYGVGIRVLNPEEEDRSNFIRRAEFEGKESTAKPVCYRISEGPDHATCRLERVDPPEKTPRRSAKPVEFPSARGGSR